MQERAFNKLSFGSVFVYLPDHGVLVCKLCKFAVQPKALPSHLLRHQVYRDERRRLLEHCSELNLREPDKVVTPSGNVEPFSCLSVQRGFRCESANCQHACISTKRMSQHWSETHHEPDSRNVRAKPVYLQTFFRGNKIKYFEVKGPDAAPLAVLEEERIRKSPRPNVDNRYPTAEQSPTAADPIVSLPCAPPSQDITPPPEEDAPPPLPLDLETLRYFHHYMHDTCLTLRRGESETAAFWQVDIVREAFQYTFLLYGILGVAAAHMTMLSLERLQTPDPAKDRDSGSGEMENERSRVQRHRRAALRYQHAALVAFRRSAQRDAPPDPRNSTALIAFCRVVGVQTCVQHQLARTYPELLRLAADDDGGDNGGSGGGGGGSLGDEDAQIGEMDSVDDGDDVQMLEAAADPIDRHPTSLARLREVVFLLRGAGEMMLAFQPLLPHGSDFLLAEEVLEGLRDYPTSSSSVADDSTQESTTLSPSSASELCGVPGADLRAIPVPGVPGGWAEVRERMAGLMRGSPHEGGWHEVERAVVETLALAYAHSGHATGGAMEGDLRVKESTKWARWNGAEGWLRRAPERYVQMLAAGEPAALVVFAYWCPLLKRLEEDHWFVRGQAAWLVKIVVEHLPGEEWRALVQGLP